MYRVIRVSSDYGVVIAVTPENSKWGTPGAKYYIYSNISNPGATEFVESSEKEVVGYFSGLADSLGLGELPKKPFSSLEKIKKWRAGAESNFFRERILNTPPDPGKEEMIRSIREEFEKGDKTLPEYFLAHLEIIEEGISKLDFLSENRRQKNRAVIVGLKKGIQEMIKKYPDRESIIPAEESERVIHSLYMAKVLWSFSAAGYAPE